MADRVDIVPDLNPHAHLILTPTNVVCSWVGSEVFALEGIEPQPLRDLLMLIDGGRSLSSIYAALSDLYTPQYLDRIVAALTQVQVIIDAPLPTPAAQPEQWDLPTAPVPLRQQAIAILGNHHLLETLTQAFAIAGFENCRAIHLQNFASCQTPEFLALQQAHILYPLSLAPAAAPVTIDNLTQIWQDVDFVVCAVEGIPWQALLDVNQVALASSTPCLFVTAAPTIALNGPNVMYGAMACLNCRLLTLAEIPDIFSDFLPQLFAPTSPPHHPLHPAIARDCIAEAISILGTNPTATRANRILKITTQSQTIQQLRPHSDCSACNPQLDRPLGVVARKAISTAAEELGRIWPESPHAVPRPAADPYRTVGILGGGTAGYLTALALRAAQPHLHITLLESSNIPVIGVGEATTPELVKFLHSPRFLGRDIVDFYQRVRPTWKLGIKFEWGCPGDDNFTFPFQRGRLLESILYESTLNQQSLGAMLMNSDRVPIFDRGDGKPLSLLHQVRWAYHLDNRRFIDYLKQEAIAAGIEQIDVEICDAQLSADGENIAHLIAADGRQFAYDLYMDCSGFSSFLLEQKLGSKFVSYQDTLGTDRAIAAKVPHNGTIKPYTLAETMDHGWCWNIPFEDADHRGYVFSSAFCSADQALAEMQAKNPGMGEPALIKFRSGRHEHFWRGNVIAIGNSYGFVEPLESTALHMIVLELELLMTHFPASQGDRAVKSILNRKLNERWDSLRWFLGIHYKFNHRLSTPFWQAANHDTNISGATERLALFQERAPLSYQSSLFYTVHPPEFFSDDHAYDTLLCGQQIPTRFVEPVVDPATWKRQLAIFQSLASTAMPQQQALSCLRNMGPDILSDFTQRRDSWLHTWLPA